MENMIDITGADLGEFVKKVYDLSMPQGLGFLHYQKGSLTDEEIKAILARGNDRIAIDMDYVKGRACKMIVFKENDKLFIRDNWYDHTEDQLRELLLYSLPENVGFPVLEGKEHNVACNCQNCRTTKRR